MVTPQKPLSVNAFFSLKYQDVLDGKKKWPLFGSWDRVRDVINADYIPLFFPEDELLIFSSDVCPFT